MSDRIDTIVAGVNRKDEKYAHQLLELIRQGFSAAVYTQTTDVEIEVNGLMTYDRKRVKVNEGKVRKINNEICNSLNKWAYEEEYNEFIKNVYHRYFFDIQSIFIFKSNSIKDEQEIIFFMDVYMYNGYKCPNCGYKRYCARYGI